MNRNERAAEIERRKLNQRNSGLLPLWQRLLWAIPKNLVYIFVGIILFAFVGMCYITYTEQNMTEFLTADRTQEIQMVAPLYTSLRKSMNPDTYV